MKIVGAELFHEGERKGRTDEYDKHEGANSCFRNFMNAPKPTSFCLHTVCLV